MVYDVRRMPLSEAVLLLNKVLLLSTYKNTNVRYDDNTLDWIVEIRFEDKSLFKAFGRGNVNDGVSDTLYLFYNPPMGGNIQFELRLEVQQSSKENTDKIEVEILHKFNEFLGKFGGRGMNFISNFEDLNLFKDINNIYEPEYIKTSLSPRRNWLQRLALWILRTHHLNK